MFLMLTFQKLRRKLLKFETKKTIANIHMIHDESKLVKNSDSTSEEANTRLIKLIREGMIGFKKTNKERIHL